MHAGVLTDLFYELLVFIIPVPLGKLFNNLIIIQLYYYSNLLLLNLIILEFLYL